MPSSKKSTSSPPNNKKASKPSSTTSSKKNRPNVISDLLSNPLFAICASFLFFTVGLSILGYKWYRRNQNIEINDLKVTNVTDSAVTITWTSKTPTTGSVVIDEEEIDRNIYLTNSSNIYHDDRNTKETESGEIVFDKEIAENRYTHHVTIRSLKPETQYYFKIRNGLALIDPSTQSQIDTQNATFTTVSTPETIKRPDPVYGKIKVSDDLNLENVNDGIVVLQRIADSGNKSHFISTTLNEGSFSLDAANVWNEDLETIYEYDGIDEEKVNIAVYLNGEIQKKGLIIQSDNDQPLPVLDFSENKTSSALKNGTPGNGEPVKAEDADKNAQVLVSQIEASQECEYSEHCQCVDGSYGTHTCTGTLNESGVCVYDPKVDPDCSSCMGCRDEEEELAPCCCDGETVNSEDTCKSCQRQGRDFSKGECEEDPIKEPDPEDPDEPSEEEGFCGNMDDSTWGGSGYYCNGSDLWYCSSQSGDGEKSETCEDGCVTEVAGKNDYCNQSSGPSAPSEGSPCGPNAWENYGCDSDTEIDWPDDLVEKVDNGEGSCIMAMCKSSGAGYKIDGCNCNTQCNNPTYFPDTDDDDNGEKGCPEGYHFVPGVDMDMPTASCVNDPAGRAGLCCKFQSKEECPEETHELTYGGYNRSDCWYYGEDQYCCPKEETETSSSCIGEDYENGEICDASNYRACNNPKTKRCVARKNGKCEWRKSDSCKEDAACLGEDYDLDEKCSSMNLGSCHSVAHKRCESKGGKNNCNWETDHSCPDSTPAQKCIGTDHEKGEDCTASNFGLCHGSAKKICLRKRNGNCEWKHQGDCPEANNTCSGQHELDGQICDQNNLWKECHDTKKKRICGRSRKGECKWETHPYCSPGASSSINNDESLFASSDLDQTNNEATSENEPLKPTENYTADTDYNGTDYKGLAQLISPVKADDTETIIISSQNGLYAFAQGGRYSFDYEGETYFFDVEDAGNWSVYIDLNQNNVPDDADIYLAEEDIVEIEVTKISELITYNLHTGWNLVSFPMLLQGEGTPDIEYASDLLKYFNDKGADVTSIANYQGSFQIYTAREGYEGEDLDYGNQNFKIYPGYGYFIRSHDRTSVGLEGRRIKGSIEIRLNPSWNLVGFYNEDEEAFSAQELLEDINNTDINAPMLTRWINGRYEGLVMEDDDTYGNNFSVYPKYGYWLRLDDKEVKKYEPEF